MREMQTPHPYHVSQFKVFKETYNTLLTLVLTFFYPSSTTSFFLSLTGLGSDLQLCLPSGLWDVSLASGQVLSVDILQGGHFHPGQVWSPPPRNAL